MAWTTQNWQGMPDSSLTRATPAGGLAFCRRTWFKLERADPDLSTPRVERLHVRTRGGANQHVSALVNGRRPLRIVAKARHPSLSLFNGSGSSTLDGRRSVTKPKPLSAAAMKLAELPPPSKSFGRGRRGRELACSVLIMTLLTKLTLSLRTPL